MESAPTPTFWRLTVSTGIVRNALRVSAVIGTILNLINQGAAILAWRDIHWGHVALNYVTPYIVATYSAAKNELDRRRRG
jgi:hypothetical protein